MPAHAFCKTPGFAGSQITARSRSGFPPHPRRLQVWVQGSSGCTPPLLVHSPWGSSREGSPLKYSHLISEQTSAMTAVTLGKMRSQATYTQTISDIHASWNGFPFSLNYLVSYYLLIVSYSVRQTLSTYYLQDIIPHSCE